MADDIHKGHRARVKSEFLKNGFEENTPPHKILEFLLFYCLPQGDTNPLAHELVDAFGGLNGVLDAPVDELIKFKGLTENNVALLKAIIPISRCYKAARYKSGIVFGSMDEIGKFMIDKFFGLTVERFAILGLDGAVRMRSFDFLSSGDISSVGVSSRQVVELVLKRNVTGVIMAHNHPQGVALPSGADISVTQTIFNALSGIGVHLLDHLIIANDDYVSLAQSSQYKHIFGY